MKQFGKILKFEFKNYLKNKMFMGITIFLVVAIAVVMFIPRIVSTFSDDEENSSVSSEDMPVMIVSFTDEGSLPPLKANFAAAFPNYRVEAQVLTVDEIKEKISSGEAECAIAVESRTSYTYYVNNLSMYDANTAIADEVLTTLYRMDEMVNSNIAPEDAAAILSTVITSNTVNLGVDQMQNYWYTYIMIFALYMVILLYGQMVATNVATEKSSRAMELLITTAKPTSMMFGKVIASCLAGFFQLVAVFGSALLFFNLNKSYWGDIPIMSSIFDMPFSLLIYMLIFFILGFFIYAFMFGAIGSTASKLEDINTSVMPITFLFIAGFMVVMFGMASGNVDTTLMKVCSYIPFTSPMAMFTRIAMSTVAWYEIAISIGLLAGSVVGIGIVAAKIYRIGVLMYGTPPKITTLLKMLKKHN